MLECIPYKQPASVPVELVALKRDARSSVPPVHASGGKVDIQRVIEGYGLLIAGPAIRDLRLSQCFTSKVFPSFAAVNFPPDRLSVGDVS